MNGLTIDHMFDLASIISSILGALGGVWLGHWLTTSIRREEKEELEKAYYAELERERLVLANQFKKLWVEYSSGQQESYTTGYWGNYEFVESLAIEGIKYGIPLWGGHATLRAFLKKRNAKINTSITKRNDANNIDKLILSTIDFSQVAGELKQATGLILFSLIAPLSHCISAIKEKDNFVIDKDFDEGKHLEKICHLTGVNFENNAWEYILKQHNKKLQ